MKTTTSLITSMTSTYFTMTLSIPTAAVTVIIATTTTTMAITSIPPHQIPPKIYSTTKESGKKCI